MGSAAVQTHLLVKTFVAMVESLEDKGGVFNIKFQDFVGRAGLREQVRRSKTIPDRLDIVF